MILLYEKDPELAAGIARAFAARGQEVRRVEAFHDVRRRVLELRPAGVLFALDQNSGSAFAELRVLDPEVPVVAMGTRRFLYGAFDALQSASLMVGGLRHGSRVVPERFWYLVAPFTAEAACDAVERAIREAAAPVPRAVARRRRLVALAWSALLVVSAVATVVGFLGALFVQRPHKQYFLQLLYAGPLLFLGLFTWNRVQAIVAALRIRLRPSWWSFAWLGLLALWALASLVRAAFR